MDEVAWRYCDLVMKGGITSGVVYPSAALELAKGYRFKNIGGTSAGAIAAAACAAAALGDRNKAAAAAKGTSCEASGFEGLRNVAEQLATPHFIFRLFQPARGATLRYALLIRTIGAKTDLARWAWLLAFALLGAPIATLLLAAPLFFTLPWLHGPVWALGALWAAGLGFVVLGSLLWSIVKLLMVIRNNLFGLCSGSGRPRWPGTQPPLTDWLHATLQSLAGKPDDAPLLFEDLWKAPRYADEPPSKHAITLQMITTDVSHQEPRTLPFRTEDFWFRRDQFEHLFPAAVVDAMMAGREKKRYEQDGHAFYPLPAAGAMPVIVAMRMSLSFPLLLSAVPLYEFDGADRTDAPVPTSLLAATDALATGGSAAKQGRLRICWFSDGGICSNFPIHLFDSPLPQWPTFAINLVDSESLDPPPPLVTLPAAGAAPPRPTYNAIRREFAPFEILGFLGGMVSTMQVWRDNLLARAPGNRERIVDVVLASNEGGLNLDMSEAALKSIAAKGAKAGDTLANQFVFANHYWVRWRAMAAAIQAFSVRAATSFDADPKIPAYQPAFDQVATGIGPSGLYAFDATQTAESVNLFQRLVTDGKRWSAGPDLAEGGPKPDTQVQISPLY